MGGGVGPQRPPPTSPWAWRPACLTPGTGWGPRAPQTCCPGRGRGRPASARPALARLEWKLGSGREIGCGGKSWCWGDPERSFLCRCVSVRVPVMRVSPCGSVGECNAVSVQGVTVHESVDICVYECVLSQCGCGCRCLSVYEWTCMCDYLCEWVWVCCTV